jgi:hypothetical protein
MEAFTALLYDLISRRLVSIIAEGYFYADGTEQTILDAGSGMVVTGYIDLSEMQAGDEVVLRMYVRTREGGEYGLYASQAYRDAQGEPVVCVLPRYTAHGMRMTLQQVKGTYRRFSYVFVRIV